VLYNSHVPGLSQVIRQGDHDGEAMIGGIVATLRRGSARDEA
jgi:hypothetical protein